MFDETVRQMILIGVGETLYMTVVSVLISYIIGLPLGIILTFTGKDGLFRNRWVNGILGTVEIGRAHV